jgi:hypothetical protein
VIEVPYWSSTIESLHFDQIYHEHLSYLTVKAAKIILHLAGLEIINVKVVDYHGGSLRIIAKHESNSESLEVDDMITKETNLGLFSIDTYVKYFSDITKKKNGIPIKTILNVFNNWEFVDKNKFIKLIKNELDDELYFVSKTDDIKNSLLTSLGVDRLIFLPRKDDFVDTEQIINFVKMYNKFREGFFNTIESFLSNDDETNIIIYLLKKLTCREDFEKFKEPLINSFLEKILNEDLIIAVEEKFKIELDKWLPILMKSKSKYHNIDTNIMKNSFGDKISNIIEERFDISKSEIKKRALIPQQVIEFIFNHKIKK